MAGMTAIFLYMVSSSPAAASDNENIIRIDRVKKIMCGRFVIFPYVVFAVYEESGTGKKISQGSAPVRNGYERL